MNTIREILDWFQAKGNRIIISDVDQTQIISAPKSISEANKNHISFINQKYASQFDEIINSTKCQIILIDAGLLNDVDEKDLPNNIAFVVSDNPKMEIIDFCKSFLNFQKPIQESVIHKTACISENAIIGNHVIIEAFVVVEENVTIGNLCIIGANTVIKKNTVIADNVVIGSCNVIGGVGFGYAKRENSNEYDQLPHYGGVIIKDKVHIGNNTCIDRGSLSDTVIEEGVKIDNLVHIAHNVKIGKNSLIIACSMIAGSVVIGENCWVAPSVIIRNGIIIGENSTLGMGCLVTKDIPANITVTGSPAMPLDEYKKLLKSQKLMMEK